MAGSKTIVFTQQKGGTGKTISVCWMAWLLSQQHRVAVVDLDPQGAATALLGAEDTYVHGAYDFMVAREVPKDAVVRSKFSNCMLVPATDGLVMAEMDTRVQSLNFEDVQRRLAKAFKSFDYILIDCSSGLGILTSMAITIADKIVMPVFLAPLELRGLKGTFAHISRMRRDAQEVVVALPVMTEPDELEGFGDGQFAIPISSVAIPYDAEALSLISSLSSHTKVDTSNPMVGAYFAFIHELEDEEWQELTEIEVEPEIEDQPDPEIEPGPEPEPERSSVAPLRNAQKPSPQAESMTDIFDALHEKRSLASDDAKETPPLPRARASKEKKPPKTSPPPPPASAAPPTYQSLRDIHNDTLDEAPKVQTWFWLRLGLALIGIGVAIIGVFTDLIGPLAMWGAVIGVMILVVPDLIMRFLLKDR
jgi:cellulose biosynthesis protein BcsQ